MSYAFVSACADFRLAAKLNRREWLRVGGLGTLALSLADLFRVRAEAKGGNSALSLPVCREFISANSCPVRPRS